MKKNRILAAIFSIIIAVLMMAPLSLFVSAQDYEPYGTNNYNTYQGEDNLSAGYDSSYQDSSNYPFVITSYNVDMKVNENNTFDIKETIEVNFNEAKHGIIRSIPISNSITRLDGTTSKNRAQITNVKISNPYTVSKSGNYYKYQIGNADQTIVGPKTYVMSYTYNIGKDPCTDYDELYFNIIGTEWDAPISNVTFSITMPKEFDRNKVGFSAGSIGSTKNDGVMSRVDGNNISGKVIRMLQPGEGLTIRAELPDNYFVGAGLAFNVVDLIMFLPVLFLLISAFLWYKFGKDDTVIDSVGFYPPDGLNSLETGFIYNGNAGSEDVVSLLIYLANKGYIKITETNEKTLFKSVNGYKISKIKEYDGNNPNERLFLNGLFNNSAREVTDDDLKNSFYETTIEILKNINSHENIDNIFYRSSVSMGKFVKLLSFLSLTLMSGVPFLSYNGFSSIIPFLVINVFVSVGLLMALGTIASKGSGVVINGKKATKFKGMVFGVFFGLIFGGAPWVFLILPTIIVNPLHIVGTIIDLICVIGMGICSEYMNKRTPYGNEMLGKIKGFKNFLETAEKDKLESMVMDNPNYFYDILPYTYVLGVSSKWIEKFETINVQPPTWCHTNSAFTTASFGLFMNNTMQSAGTSIVSSPSSSSGGFSSGGSSGGGSSGGGSGGGGGSSW